MREHWQPSTFGRLEQGSRVRALMVERARAAWSTAEPSLLFLPPSQRGLLTRLPGPFRVVSATLSVAIGLASTACGPTPAPKPSEVRQPGSSPVLATKVETTPERILPLSGPVYFTQGAHSSDGSSTGIKSGIDLAPKRVVNCALGTRAVVEEQIARATASGIITIVGNERDTNDPNHSIVEIQEDGTGLRFEVMHLAELPNHIQVGGRVSAGFLIGKSSCEVPKGGKTTGVHLHQYVKNQKGNYLPINGLTFSGWTIQGDIMTKGGEKRVADQRRCATDQACGGIRNDLGTGAVLGESVKVAALPTVALAKPAPPAEKPVQPGFTQYPSTVNPYQIDSPNGYYISANNRAKTDVFVPHDFWSSAPSATILIMTEPINSWVNLEAHKIKASNQSPFNQVQNPPRFVPKLVDGRDGWIFEHINPGSSMPYARMVVFVYKDLGWTVTLNASRANSATIETDRQLLDRMVSSMKLR